MPKGYEDSVFCLNCSHIQRISEDPSCQSCGCRDLEPVCGNGDIVVISPMDQAIRDEIARLDAIELDNS